MAFDLSALQASLSLRPSSILASHNHHPKMRTPTGILCGPLEAKVILSNEMVLASPWCWHESHYRHSHSRPTYRIKCSSVLSVSALQIHDLPNHCRPGRGGFHFGCNEIVLNLNKVTFEHAILIWEYHVTTYLPTSTSQYKLLGLHAVIPLQSSTTE
jgi:hypothetical protein